MGAVLEPSFPDGAWALFRTPASTPLLGHVVLLARGVGDDEREAFLLKKITAVRRLRGGGYSVTLASFNPAYPPFDLRIADLADLRAVADVVGLVAQSRAAPRSNQTH